MAQYSAPLTLLVPGPTTITFNGAGAPTYYVDPDQCTGLDMAPIRAPIDEKPQGDGGIVHPFLLGPRHVVLAGVLLADTDGARNDLEDALNAALLAIVAADGTLTWTPTGESARVLTVRCDIAAQYPGSSFKRFIFGLVAANPTFA